MEKRTVLSLELGRLRGTETPKNTTVEGDYTRTQYLRLPADYSEESSLDIKDLCLLANESQSFYRSVSLQQWVRTVITKYQDDLIIHSNVVPRQAYFQDATCLGSHCRRGFSLASEITDGLGIFSPRSCQNCALAQQMRIETEIDHMAVDQSNTLLEMEEVKDVQDLAEGSQGSVYKILWHSGTFVKKRFTCKGIFYTELQVVKEVLHPNIVHCFGFSLVPESDAVDLFMEYLEIDLQRFLIEAENGSRPPFSFRDSLDVLLQVAEAVKHLHEKNFLHGDLKPQNIFMSRFELVHSGVQYYLVKVGDFGCAQRVDSSGATVDAFCAGIGTTNYTAPEVFRCRKKYGSALPPKHPQKIDVYSFGVVAYQVLIGVAKLYAGCRKSKIPEEVIDGSLRPDCGFKETLDHERASLLTYVKKCWADNPEERPSFSEICDELIKRSKDHILLGNTAKRKHHDSIVEGTKFVRSLKAVWTGSCSKHALSDQNDVA